MGLGFLLLQLLTLSAIVLTADTSSSGSDAGWSKRPRVAVQTSMLQVAVAALPLAAVAGAVAFGNTTAALTAHLTAEQHQKEADAKAKKLAKNARQKQARAGRTDPERVVANAKRKAQRVA